MAELHEIESEEVMAYLDGQLSEERASRVAAHLKECVGCELLARDLRSVSAKMEEWTVPMEHLQMNSALAGAVKKVHAKRGWGWYGKWAAAAAGVAVALAVIVPLPGPPEGQAGRVQVFSYPVELPVAQEVSSAAPAGQQGSRAAAMIARTSQLIITTKDFAKVRPGLDDILKRHQGYIGQLSTRGADNAHTLEATLRVPADQLDAVTAELKKFGRVDLEAQSGEELTQQYTDLEARLTNGRNSERRLTGILQERTGRLADVLDVEREIERVRGEIESMEAQRKSMANRVDFATISLTVREDYTAQLNMNPDSTFARFRNAGVEGYRTMLEGVIGLVLFLLSYGPTLLVWSAVLFFPARLAWRWRSRALGNK
jgi:hypothetical protein